MKQRVVSGIRPTGKLHWGHYFGVIQNWVALQKQYQCYYFLADWHALTSEYADVGVIKPSVLEVLADLFAAGIDPKKSVVFIQSHVPQQAELHLLLSMITPLGWLERVPSYKDMQQQLSDRDLSTYGFLGYPLLQAADILIYKAAKVPVGEDQVAHIELAREIVRRFHFLMKREDVFVEPQPLLTQTPRIPGVDGRKMSKSFGNAIYLSDDEKTVETKMMNTITDPARKLRTDPGHPEVCNIFAYHKLFTTKEMVDQIDKECRSAQIGCVDCKKLCIANAIAYFRPFQEKRREWAAKPDELLKIAENNSKKAGKEAEKNMKVVRSVMGISYEEKG
jgi:tryptophanyl-tRNA synthetase